MKKKAVTGKMVLMFVLLILMSMLTSITFPAVEAEHHPETVDGDPSDWVGTPPATTNTGTYSEFEYIWRDEVGDDTGNGTYTYPTAINWATGQPWFTGGEADLVELRITTDSSYVYFLLAFDNITDNGWVNTAGWLSDPDQAETTPIAICIDTDRVYDSGFDLVDDGSDGISADILLPPEAWWEYLIEIALNDVVLWRWDPDFEEVWDVTRKFPCAASTTVYETIEFAVPIDPYGGLHGLPDPTNQIWRFSVFTGVQDFEHFREVNAVTSEWNGGGGADHPYDPDAYDAAFFATRAAQEAAFNGFTEVDYAVISAYMDIDMDLITGPPLFIYIRADGSVDPPTAPIQRDGDLYTFTDNIYVSIVVKRDNIVIDGAGYTLQGTGSGTGIGLSGRTNVTIRNTQITNFDYGIRLYYSSNYNSISGNNITANNGPGISLHSSSNNSISGNNITANNWVGIGVGSTSNYNSISENNIKANDMQGIILSGSSNNKVSRNVIVNNWLGIWLIGSSNNLISGNNIKANTYDGIWQAVSSNNTIIENTIANNGDDGIMLYKVSNNTIIGNTIANNGVGIWYGSSSDNQFYHNNFVYNWPQVYDYRWADPSVSPSVNAWDDGYPSGGNYWSDHTDVDLYSGPFQNETGGDGIWDHPYTIDANNQDRYPLVNPWTPPAVPFITATVDIDPDTLNLKSKGEWITCYIELPEGYNVSDIDRSTMMLNDTVPVDPFWVNQTLESVIGDHDYDGIPDLMVKFNRTQVIDLMTVGNQTIKITGELIDGTPFEGTDMIRAIHAQITLTDVHGVHLDVEGAFLQGENLKVKFYSYSGEYQGETTVWSGTTPAQILLSTDLPHNSPIENAIFVLTDNEENTILNLVNFVVGRSDLFGRIAQIDTEWTYALPTERTQLWQEIIEIDMQWPYAPP